MKRLLVLAAVALGLAGCSSSSGAPPTAANPREGRVTIAWSNCGTGSCIYDYKICVGPDLLMLIGGRRYWVRSSGECKP